MSVFPLSLNYLTLTFSFTRFSTRKMKDCHMCGGSGKDKGGFDCGTCDGRGELND